MFSFIQVVIPQNKLQLLGKVEKLITLRMLLLRLCTFGLTLTWDTLATSISEEIILHITSLFMLTETELGLGQILSVTKSDQNWTKIPSET